MQLPEMWHFQQYLSVNCDFRMIAVMSAIKITVIMQISKS